MKFLKIIILKYKIGHHHYCAERNKKVISRSVHDTIVKNLTDKLFEVVK